MLKNSSPLKHKGSHVPYASEEEYHKVKGGEVAEKEEEKSFLTGFDILQKIKQNDEQKIGEDKKEYDPLSVVPETIPSSQDRITTPEVKPVVVTENYKRIKGDWYDVKDEENPVKLNTSHKADDETKIVLQSLNEELYSRPINAKDAGTWIGKDNLTIKGTLENDKSLPGIRVEDEMGLQDRVTITTPWGQSTSVSADDPDSEEDFRKLINSYDSDDYKSKNPDLVSALGVRDAKEFNNAWGVAGYSTVGGKLYKDGEEIDLTAAKEKVRGYENNNASSYSMDVIKAYLWDNASDEDIARIKKESQIQSADQYKQRKEYIDKLYTSEEITKQGKVDYILNDFTNEFIHDLNEAGVSEETKTLFRNKADKVRKTLKDNKLKRLAGEPVDDDMTIMTLTDLEPILNQLKTSDPNHPDIAIIQKIIKDRTIIDAEDGVYDETLAKGALRWKNKIIDQKAETYIAKTYRENPNSILAKIGGEYDQLELYEQKDVINDKVENLYAEYDKKLIDHSIALTTIAKDAEQDGITLEYQNPDNFTVSIKREGEEITEKDEALLTYYTDQLKRFNDSLNFDQEQFIIESDKLKLDYLDHQNRSEEVLLLNDVTSRENRLWKMNSIKINNGFRSLSYSGLFARGVLASNPLYIEKATEKQEKLKKGVEIGLENPIDYKTAIERGEKFRFVTGELSTQTANIVTAIATAGVGSAVGLGAYGTSALIGYGVFGTYSGSQKYMELSMDQQAGEEAKKRLAQLENNKESIDPDEYRRLKIEYEKAIAYGDISLEDKKRASWNSYLIEGTISTVVGTAPNSINLIKKFRTPTVGIENQLLRGNLKAIGHVAYQSGRGIAGEVFEEVSIEGLDILSDGLVLSRDMDYSVLDDVAVTALITSPGMTILPNTYNAIMTQTATSDYRNEVSKSFNKIKEIEERFANIDPESPDASEMRRINTDELKAEIEKIVGEHTKLEADVLAMGSGNVKKLLKAAVEENYLNMLAGVKPGDTKEQVEERRKTYMESLSKKDRKIYEEKLRAIEKQRERIVENIDYENAVEKIYGKKGELEKNKLKKNPKYKQADKRGKVAMVIENIREQHVKNNIKKAKADPSKVAYVENNIYGMPFSETGRKNKKTKQENALYEDIANSMLVDERTALIVASETSRNAKELLNEEQLNNLEIVEAKNKEEIIEAVDKNEKLTAEQKSGIIEGLMDKEAGVKGVLLDNKYIVTNKKLADANLRNGDLIQGTVLAHEVSHVVDNISFKDEAEHADYTHKLYNFMSKTSPEAHEVALRRVNYVTNAEGLPLYQPDKSFEEQDLRYKDEYTKAVQDILMSPYWDKQYNDVKKKASTLSIKNIIPAITGGDFTIYNEKNAAAWMVNYIENFKKGKLSPLAKRKIKAAKDPKNRSRSTVEYSTVESAKENLQKLTDEASVVNKETGEKVFAKNKFDPNSLELINELPGMIKAQVDNWFNKYPQIVKGFMPDAIVEMKRELSQDVMVRMLESKADRSFDGRGTLYGFLNGRIRYRMLDHFADPNVTVIPDFSKQELNEQRQELDKEFADDLTKIQNQESDQPRHKVNMLTNFTKLSPKQDAVREIVNVKDGDTHIEVVDSKNINGNTGKVAEEIFNTPAKKILDRDEKGKSISANLTYAKTIDENGIPEPSEAGNIQSFYNNDNDVKNLIRSLPEFNITLNDSDINDLGENIQVSLDTKGRSLGLKNRLIDFFYESYIDPKATSEDVDVRAGAITNPKGRSKGKTSQTPVYRLKPEFRGKNITKETIQKVKDEAGITPRLELNKYDRTIGQFLKGLAFYQAQQATLSAAQRNLADQLQEIINDPNVSVEAARDAAARLKQQIADITVGQGKYAFSAANVTNKIYDSVTVSPTFEGDLKKVDTLLDAFINEGRHKFDSEENINKFYEDVENIWIPTLPKDMVTKRIIRPSGRVLGANRNKQIIVNGKKMTIDQYYTQKRDELFLTPEQRKEKGLKSLKYGKPFTGKAENFKPRKYGDVFGDSPESFQKANNDGTIKEFNDMNLAMHRQLWQRINKSIEDDPKNAKVWGNYFSTVSVITEHPHRLGAEFLGWSPKPRGYEGKLYEWEHAMPATRAYLYLLEAALDENYDFDTSYDLVIDNFKLVALDNYDDKVNIKGAGRTTSMGKGWNIITDSWLKRYFDKGINIDPKSIIGLDGRTFEDIYNINSDGNLNIVNENHIDSYNMSKAISNSRKINHKTKPKGITVLDFDDTLATTKSGVRAAIPNPEGTPKPKRKVIFLAGGAGSGKSNVVKKLGLENQGFKIVNSDISLEWLKKNSGLPENMNDLTKEQKSKLGSLQHQARGIAKRKMMKYQGQGDGVVVDGTGGSINVMNKLVNEFKEKGYDVSMMFVETSLETALERNANRKERSLLDVIVRKNHEAVQGNKKGFKKLFGKRFMEVKTDNLTLKDPMPNNLITKMDDFVSGYEKRRLDAEEFALEGADLLAQGAEFDFSEFNVVTEGQVAPLFNKAMKLQKKFGNKDMFVLTARPAESAPHIHKFLKANGLNIPLKNITGLANSTPEAKALWMADKVAEGYNDFYFADDALQNVQAVKNMLDQFDVKSKIQQAKVQFSKDMNSTFNTILEEKSGIEAGKRFSAAKAELRGKNKGRFKWFIPPSAEDFKGLLYAFLPKGAKGEKAMAFFKRALLDPYARGYRELNIAKQTIGNDYKALRKAMPDVRKKLTKKIPNKKDFRYADAVRVYLWDKAGYEIPGLSKNDKLFLTNLVKNDSKLKSFADTLGLISKRPEGYVKPQEYWLTTNILGDLSDAVDKIGRKEFLAEWRQNKDEIFSKENLNKIEAIYGKGFREALEDMLYRMENGTNRNVGDNRLVNQFLNWTNNSVGAIMFFNARSAVLQTLSTVNFINWGDNNLAKAAIRFADQPQFWKDFATLFNSDMLKQRRKGLKTDVNHAELTEAVGRARDPLSAALNWFLQKGFLPTQMADSFAIASGGATFYRNRINTYLKEGLTQEQAETKAFEDFQEIAEETQQSSRPDLISQQQASVLGRLILAFQNTPMQYMRLTKKAVMDLAAGRGDAKTHISRILYYGAIQNVIFYSLQSALFALAFDDEEEEEPSIDFEKRKKRILNGMLDSILRGTGVYGAIVSTIKNVILKLGEEQKEDAWRREEVGPLVEALNLSPPIGSKARKFVSAQKSWNYNEDVIKEMDVLDIDNPIWDAVGNVVSMSTNFPLDRLVNKTKNIREALNDDNEAWQRIALIAGWNRWDLNIKSDKVELVKTEIKEQKKIESKKKADEKREEEKKIKLRNENPGKSDVEIQEIIKLKEKNKEVYDLNKRQQVKILEANNLNPKDYPKEKDRVDAIMNLRKENENKIDSTLTAIKNYVPTEDEQRSIELFKLTKKDQVNLLMDLGVSSKVIKSLKYEEDRVKKIMELQKKVKKQ